MAKKRVYVTPKSTVIADYVQKVCDELSDGNDDSLKDPAVTAGLTDFLNFMAEIVAKRLNSLEAALLDSENGES